MVPCWHSRRCGDFLKGIKRWIFGPVARVLPAHNFSGLKSQGRSPIVYRHRSAHKRQTDKEIIKNN
jgi:hypothetical protein